MARKYVIFSILISLFFLLSFPKTSRAEIATTKDWIGLFSNTDISYLKSNTIPNCPSLDPVNKYCWVYTSSCTQTAGTIPLLVRNGLSGNPSPCIFTLNPTPPTNKSYVFRLMANNTESLDAIIASKALSYGTSPNPVPINGILYSVKKDPEPDLAKNKGNGDLTIPINSNIVVQETGIIFVEGNLYINSNLTNNNPKKGLVFVVKGGIYINRNVTEVDAYLISHGKNASNVDTLPFCSAWNGTTPPDPNPDGINCTDYTDAEHLVNSNLRKQLTINGSVISLNAAKDPKFVRKYAAVTNNTDPAEIVNFEAKYLVILKDIFSRDLKIWREIQ